MYDIYKTLVTIYAIRTHKQQNLQKKGKININHHRYANTRYKVGIMQTCNMPQSKSRVEWKTVVTVYVIRRQLGQFYI